MWPKFVRFFTDEDSFEHAFAALWRLIMIGGGVALQSGVIPTGVHDGGKWAGLGLMLLSAFIRSNQPAVEPARGPAPH